MASFLAPTNRPSFAPYISTAAPEMYIAAASQKQAQYNQGVERVQSYIDNVTGLKTGRPEDEQYLRQRVQDLKASMEGIATADYSTKQIVQNAGGIAAKIYNDPRIIQSVISAQNKAEMLKQLEEAQASGDYSAANADPIIESIQRWQQGGTNATLSKQTYTPYYNYQPELVKYLKNIHADVYVDPVAVNPDGTPKMYIDETKRTLLSPDKVRASVESFFQTNNQAKTQREFDLRYGAKGMSDKSAQQFISNYGVEKVKEKDKTIKGLQEELALEGDATEKGKQIKAEIELHEAEKASIANQQKQYQENYLTDPFSTKASILNEQMLNGVANTYSYGNTERNIKENPIYKAQVEAEDRAWERAYKLENQQIERDKEAAKNKPQGTTTYQPAIYDNEKVTATSYEDNVLKPLYQSTENQKAKLVYDMYGQTSGIKYDPVTERYSGDKKEIDRLFNQVNEKYHNGTLSGVQGNIAKTYFEDNSSETGYGGLKSYQSAASDWENEKKKNNGITYNDLEKQVLAAGYTEEQLNSRVQSRVSEVMSGRKVDITYKDLMRYRMESELSGSTGLIKAPKIAGWTEQKTKDAAFIYQDLLSNGLDQKVLNIIDRGAKGVAKTTKEMDNVAAKKIFAKSYPTYTIAKGQTGFESKIAILNDYASRLSTTGSDKAIYEDFVAAQKDAEAKGGTASISVRKLPGNEYQATIVGGEKPTSIPINRSVALSIDPSLANDVNPYGYIEASAREPQNYGWSAPEKKVVGDYQIRYKFKSRDGGRYSVQVEAAPKGDNPKYTVLEGVGDSPVTIVEHMGVINNPSFAQLIKMKYAEQQQR